MAESRENIVMFPFMAQGHIIPFLALALQLENRGYTITFVNTPLNIKRMRSSLPSNSSFSFKEIPFNSVEHGLPLDCENTNDLPYHLILKLFEASLSLKSEFEKIMHNLVREQNGHPPLCLISDVFLGFCADVAHEYGVHHVLLSVVSGFSLACYVAVAYNLSQFKQNAEEFTLPGFGLGDTKIHITQLSQTLRSADGSDSFSVYLRKVLHEAKKVDAMMFNTVEKIDDIGLTILRHKFQVPMWSVGPLLLPTTKAESRAGKEAGISPEVIKTWLDSKPPGSVLYISFGSQNTPSHSQMMQLAMALEASGKNFIWVVRPPIGFDINSDFEANKYLPLEFEKRMLDERRGLLVRKWAPQLEILSHKSTGAFLCQCGGNSVLEALVQGVPLMGWPMASEQFFTSLLLTERLEVCVEVARGKSMEVKHEEIRAKIELVMNETEESKKLRRRACQIRDVLLDAVKDDPEIGYKGSSVRALDDFLNTARLFRSQKWDKN